MEIPLVEWSAWAPGIDSIDHWNEYFNCARTVNPDLKPDTAFLPAMFRRRLSPLCRMIFHTVNNLENQHALSTAPVVFGSRHGELEISVDLILSELSERPFSPAMFSMSVHNSPAGLLSIHYRNKAPANAVSAGKETLKMALAEAIALLKTYGSCLIIYADMPQIEIYSEYNDEDSFPVCIALLLTQDTRNMELTIEQNDSFAARSVIRQLCEHNRRVLA